MAPSGEQTLKEVKRFCHQIGSTLQILEEGTQHTNRAEFYIGLLKESVRKDIRDLNCPLVLWEYCDDRRSQIHNITAWNVFQLEY